MREATAFSAAIFLVVSSPLLCSCAGFVLPPEGPLSPLSLIDGLPSWTSLQWHSQPLAKSRNRRRMKQRRLLLKRFSNNPDVGKAMTKFENAQRAEERFRESVGMGPPGGQGDGRGGGGAMR